MIGSCMTETDWHNTVVGTMEHVYQVVFVLDVKKETNTCKFVTIQGKAFFCLFLLINYIISTTISVELKNKHEFVTVLVSGMFFF